MSSCSGDDESLTDTGGTGGSVQSTTNQETDNSSPVGQDGFQPSGIDQNAAGQTGAEQETGQQDTTLPDAGGQTPDTGGQTTEIGEQTDTTVSDTGEAVCGNGIIESEEQCDGSSLNGETCLSLGLGDGSLLCSTDCHFDLSGCTDTTDEGAYGEDATAQPDAAPPREDLGVGSGRDVICIGDSWMNLGISGIQQSLVRVSGQPYRTYGIPATLLLNGQIPSQYDLAKRQDPDIKTVVMTGGGNDFIMNPMVSIDCANQGELCQETGERIRVALRELYTRMNDDGVRDVIYIMYSGDVGLRVDSDDMVPEGGGDACPTISPLRCHMLPTTEIMAGETLEGIHPAPAACNRIAEAIVDMMEERGMRR